MYVCMYVWCLTRSGRGDPMLAKGLVPHHNILLVLTTGHFQEPLQHWGYHLYEYMYIYVCMNVLIYMCMYVYVYDYS